MIMCIWSDITEVQGYEIHCVNAGRLFQSLGAKYEQVLHLLVDFAILGTTKSPEFCSLGSGLDWSVIED